jgi:epoxide hydrolase-like predicted phosphatase
MTIKAIIFDFGGVLVRTADRSSRQRLERRLGLAEWQSEKIVFNNEMGQKAQRGEATNEALWQSVADRLSLSPEALTQFQQEFWGGDALDEALVDLIRALKTKYATALISNATDGLRQTLTGKYPVADAFDLIVISAEEKTMKPGPEIYLRTLDRLGVKAAESVFVDDFAENIVAARSLGMQAIHFNPSVNVAAELKKLGVNL